MCPSLLHAHSWRTNSCVYFEKAKFSEWWYCVSFVHQSVTDHHSKSYAEGGSKLRKFASHKFVNECPKHGKQLNVGSDLRLDLKDLRLDLRLARNDFRLDLRLAAIKTWYLLEASQRLAYISEVRVLMTNRKSYMSFRLVPKSVTLNDTERRNGVILRYFSEFG